MGLKPPKGKIDSTYFGHKYSYDWGTEPALFNFLNKKYHFNLDPDAEKESAKVSNYYDIKKDGLKQPWDGRVFLNPPFGNAVKEWMKKAKYEITHNDNCELIVAILAARTDSKWFQEYCLGNKIIFIRGR